MLSNKYPPLSEASPVFCQTSLCQVCFDECNRLRLVVLGQMLHDGLALRILLFRVGPMLDEPQKKIPVVEQGDFKKQRRSEIINCIKIRPSCVKPFHRWPVVLNGQKMKDALPNAVPIAYQT
jgi:hypothetical protein